MKPDTLRHDRRFPYLHLPLTLPGRLLYCRSIPPKARQNPNLSTIMALSVGTRAPDFSLSTKTSDGPELVKLSEQIGSGPVVLLFFPMAFTGVCTEEFCNLSEGLADFESLKAKVFGISGDNPFAQEAWAQKENIKVTLLSDYEHAAAKAYGVAYDAFLPALNLPMGGVAKRSAFVIDNQGIIQYAESSDDPKKLPDFEAIKAKLGELDT